ncbi:MAG: 16S rRNA (guanine(527)-N(7))-methyltransferase RsmG [Woeseiaceae bacterium]|nr:16S rRNA (guanine(527)-N(7))-methyltransferase RsmG [Woeseiaceae bacterium]
MPSLSQQVETAVRSIDPDAAERAEQYVLLLSELERWGSKVNLTAIRSVSDMIAGHLLDSLVVRPLLQGTRVLDVGTGAGFPGLPLAIAEPAVLFELIDSNNKKIMFVQHTVRLLGLDNVFASKARSEDYAPGHRFDTVIARAVAAIARLLEIAGHHVGENGVFVALKGRYPAEELKEIPREWEYDVQELAVPGLEKGSRHAVLLRRRVAGQDLKPD